MLGNLLDVHDIANCINLNKVEINLIIVVVVIEKVVNGVW